MTCTSGTSRRRAKTANLLPGDIGRRLNEIRPNLDVHDLGAMARETIDTCPRMT